MDSPPVWIHSTGAITRPAFSEDAKLAKRAAWDHSYGALLVETQGPFWWIWQLNAQDNGSFIHHDREYSAKGVEPAPPALALITGDEHVIAMDRGVEEATYGDHGIIKTLHPQKLVVHDIYDGLSISPYDDKDPLQRYLRDRRGETDAVAELHLTGKHMARGAEMVEEYWVAGSNHNDWLSRWIKGNPPSSNALLWHELNAALRRTMDADDLEVPDAFETWMRQHYEIPNIRFLRRDEAALIGEIDCSLHGDKGADGARGSVKVFAKTSYKAVTAHLHRPAIEKGVKAVGVSTDSRHYQAGLTTWDQVHVAIYGNGKSSLMPIRDGRWRAK